MVEPSRCSPEAEASWLDDAGERRVIYAALDSFCAYRRVCHYNVTHLRRQSFYALPAAQWNLLVQPPFNYLDTLIEVDKAIDANAHIAEAIARHATLQFGLAPASNATGEQKQDEMASVENGRRGPDGPWVGASNAQDRDKARSTLRQLYRDWSAEGAPEREACYGPVLQSLDDEFSHLSRSDKASVNVLIPGAGLGRLLVEVVKAGYTAEGNEISYHQLMTSSFILNGVKESQQLSLYPFALSFSNHLARRNQLRRVLIPDMHPASMLNDASAGQGGPHAFERMSMSAADFCVSFKEPQNEGRYDAVATVFFIDTAPNLVAYIEAVRHCLKSGGVWINHGPLVWHFENNPPGRLDEDDQQQQLDAPTLSDSATETSSRTSRGSCETDRRDKGIAEPGSFELADDEVRALVERFGFKIEKYEWGSTRAGYIQDGSSMLLNEYRPSFWVARKV